MWDTWECEPLPREPSDYIGGVQKMWSGGNDPAVIRFCGEPEPGYLGNQQTQWK